jgi:hypothetical protein
MNSKNNKGFIYCLYNPTFKSYGDNVYKLGKTKNLSGRMSAYTTSYVDKSKYILTSMELNDKNIAEKLLFKELEKYRVSINREFFNCDIKIIKEAFEKVEKNCNNKFTRENNMILYMNKHCKNKDKPDHNTELKQQIMELQKEMKEYKEQLLLDTINIKFTQDCKKIFKEMLKQLIILSYNDREVVENTWDNKNVKGKIPLTFEEDLELSSEEYDDNKIAENDSDSDSEIESKFKDFFNKTKVVKPKEIIV